VAGRIVVDSLVPDRLPFITFFPVLAISGLFGSVWPTLILLVALSVTGSLWMSPFQSDPLAFRAMTAAMFFLSGGALVAIVARLTAAQTRLKRLEARTQLINLELKHRLKNVLGVIDAVLKQSVSSATSLDEFSADMSGRIRAIAAAQDLLKPQSDQPAELIELIDVAVKPLIPSRDRLRLIGANTTIPGDLIAPLALVFHELATNALKYGAWATADGIVILNCTALPRSLVFVWDETALAGQTGRAGFGTILIHRALPSAKVDHEVRPTGVHCRIEVQLAG
jgi:two-component system CheB/CheR fusion protein